MSDDLDNKLSADYDPSTGSNKATGDVGEYYINASKVDQGLLGPDDRSRTVCPQVVVHESQAKTKGLLSKAKGTFVKYRNLETLAEEAKAGRKLVIGGPFNNAQAAFVPREAA